MADVLQTLHTGLFNALTLYLLALGVWAAVNAARGTGIAGNFFGAVVVGVGLAAAVLVIGLLMLAQGLRPERTTVYILYMAWLVIIMPGLFAQLRGRDDRAAAFAFGVLCIFNFTVALSMVQRNLVAPWLPGA